MVTFVTQLLVIGSNSGAMVAAPLDYKCIREVFCIDATIYQDSFPTLMHAELQLNSLAHFIS